MPNQGTQKPQGRPPYPAPAGSQWQIGGDGQMKLVPVGGARRQASTAGERAAGLIDRPSPGFKGSAAERNALIQLKQLPKGILEKEPQRAAQRLTIANDPNIPDEEKPYLPGSLPARVDSIEVKLPLAIERAKTKRDRDIAERKAKRDITKEFRTEIRTIRKEMVRTIKDDVGENVRVNPVGSDSFKDLQSQLDEVKAAQKAFNSPIGSKDKPKQVTSDDDFANVKSGEYFIDPNGQLRGPKP